MKIKIAIADDHIILTETLKSYLSSDDRLEVISSYSNSTDTITGIKNQIPDVLLLDLSMPEKGKDNMHLVTGFDVLTFIKVEKLPVKVIILSNFDNYSFIQSAIKNGASGYLLKNEQPDFLVESIINVFMNKVVFSKPIRLKMENPISDESLSSSALRLSTRERDILDFVSRGFKTEDIAQHLSLHKDTVSDYRNVLMKKFDAKNAPHLIRLAAQWKILKLD